MIDSQTKIEEGLFGRKVSVLKNPAILRCDRSYGSYTQEDIDLFREMYAYYFDDEPFDDVS